MTEYATGVLAVKDGTVTVVHAVDARIHAAIPAKTVQSAFVTERDTEHKVDNCIGIRE